MDHSQRIERSIEIEASPDEVWGALTESDQISSWFGARGEIDLRRGGRASFRFPDGRVRHAVVEEAEPPRRLLFRWLPFQELPGGLPEVIPNSTVEFVIEETVTGARLVVVESQLGAAPVLR